MPILSRVPLRHTEDFKIKDTEEEEKNDPKSKKTQNCRKTRAMVRMLV